MTEVIVVTSDEKSVSISEREMLLSVAVETYADAVVSEVVESRLVISDERDVVISEVEEIHYVFVGEQGPAGPPGPAAGEEMPYAERTDFVGEDVIYRGYAVPGVLDSEPLWRIKRMDVAIDGDVTTTWAGGSSDFIHAWDSRASYTYS